jgi:hypothetical protein
MLSRLTVLTVSAMIALAAPWAAAAATHAHTPNPSPEPAPTRSAQSGPSPDPAPQPTTAVTTVSKSTRPSVPTAAHRIVATSGPTAAHITATHATGDRPRPGTPAAATAADRRHRQLRSHRRPGIHRAATVPRAHPAPAVAAPGDPVAVPAEARHDGLWLLLGSLALVVLIAASVGLSRVVTRLHREVYGRPVA